MSSTLDLRSLLTTLAMKRPIFHSEADFQHAFAWEIHLQRPDAKIRLEYRPALVGAKMYVDIWVVLPDAPIIALELKYKTRRLEIDLDGEAYRLLNQSAQDQARYDFLRDVERLEQVTASAPSIIGAAILLTNDSSYWGQARTQQSADAAFRLHEGRSLTGELLWGLAASAGTKRGREAPIGLLAPYSATWSEYSRLESHRAGVFRYLAFHVAAGRICA